MNRYTCMTLDAWDDEEEGMTSNDLSKAIQDAEKSCVSLSKAVVVIEIVRIVRPSTPAVELPEWAQVNATPAAQAAEPERFKVGDVVEARLTDDVKFGRDEFRRATVCTVSSYGSKQPVAVKFSDNGSIAWPYAENIRRPVAPHKFSFGERVRVGKDNCDEDYSGCHAFFFDGPDDAGDITIILEDIGEKYFPALEVHPI